jgi:hypothetical protein
MIPTIAINEILETFVNALAADTALNDYCQTQFAKDVTIFMGYNGETPPAVTDCPYIVIYPDQKVEGADENIYKYTIPADWAVANETQTTSGKIVTLAGIGQCDAMGQLILACLNNVSAEHPIVTANYRIAATKPEAAALHPQTAGQMKLTINVARSIGAAVSYP